MKLTLFDNLTRWEACEYGTLLLSLILIPLSWRLGIIGIGLMTIAAIVKMVATHKVGNPSLGSLGKWSMGLMIAYWCIYLVSGLLSNNQALGIERAETRLPLLILPLIAFLSDLSYLKGECPLLQGKGWNLKRWQVAVLTQWATMTLIACVCLLVALVRWLLGTPLGSLMEMNFYPIHHSYAALYAVVAMVGGWAMMREAPKSKVKTGLLIASEALLALMVIMVNSRAGMVFLALLLVIMLIDLIVARKRWKSAVVLLLLICGVGTGIYQVIPPQYKRFTRAIREIKAGHSGDIRTQMMQWGLTAVEGHWLTGLGSGDYEGPLQDQYHQHGFEEGVECNMGTHNQYLETLLQCGLLCLLPLLALLLLPCFGQGESRFWVRMTILAIGVEIFFESILGRQMGVQFISVIYVLVAHACDNKNTTKEHESE